MNRGAVKPKTIIVMVILMLTGVLGVLGISTARTYLSGAAAGGEPKNVLAKPGDDGRSATISWNSDKESMGIVEYGTTPASLLLRATETEAATSHRLSLSPLKANSNYYFRIKIREKDGTDVIYDNNGIPYSFKTKAGEGEAPNPPAGGLPSVIPTVPVAVPTVAGICNKTTDYNGDGRVNSLDYIECINKNPGAAAVPASGSGESKCPSGVDYNGDGVYNALDRIKCLQGN